MQDNLAIAIAQIAPVFLDKNKTIVKIKNAMIEAAFQKAKLVCFGETILPGYPFWLEHTDGARFNDKIQKEIFSFYLQQSVSIADGDLRLICGLAKQLKIAVYIGIAERANDRGGHSIYCSLVYVDADRNIQSVHRKLMPTYEERLLWGIGDGNRLKVH